MIKSGNFFCGVDSKVSLRMAMSRMKLLRNKRVVQVRQMRRDVAQLLQSGQDQTARIRVIHLFCLL
jgi:Regulator of Vps4 activity in the MVB pathway